MKKFCGWLGRLAAGILLACVLVSGAAVAAEPELAGGHTVSPFAGVMITVRQVNVRLEPGSTSVLLGSLEKGQVLNACGLTDNGWYQVVYETGIGYVSRKLVTQVPVENEVQEAMIEQAALVKATLAAQQAAVAQQEQIGQGTAIQTAPVQQETQAALTSQEAAAAQQPMTVPGGNVIFVGDSRTGQMGNAVGGSAAWPQVAFVACFGGGNEWLSGTQAKAEIDRFVGPGSVIVLNYGVNDLSKHNEYIATINKYARDWREKGAVVYFATVGPVGENEFGKRNWAVEYFNDQLSNRLDGSIGRIPLYSYLTMTGYTTTADGLHYTPDVYARIFQYLMQSIGKL